MAYMFATSPCIGCNQLFSYNPELVPSIRVNSKRQPDPNGTREPLCKNCIERGNEIRKSKGLPPIQVMPGAYDFEEVP